MQLCPCTTFTRMSEVFCPCLCASLSMYHCIHKNACVVFAHVCVQLCPCTTFTRMSEVFLSMYHCIHKNACVLFVHICVQLCPCIKFTRMSEVFVHICVRLCAAVSTKTELREEILPDQPPTACCDGVCKFVMLQR